MSSPNLLLSIVFPIYNEEPGLPYLREAVTKWRATQPYDIEVILVDDGSTDRSFSAMKEWAQTHERTSAIKLSRNFGHQVAVTAGLHATRGDAVVIMDADLQDPLEVIPEMILKFKEGFDVVYGQRTAREGEGWLKLFTAWAFYRIMRRFVYRDLPIDTGDFRLVSRRCLNAVLQMPETHRFLRGMFSWVGFNQTAVQYRRDARKFGETKYPLSKMLKLAWNASLSFSVFPIKMISFIGTSAAIFSLAYGVYSIFSHYILKTTVPGWTALVVLLGFLGGVILFALGIIGEYIGRIFEEIKGRPLFIIQEQISRSPQPTDPQLTGAFR